MSDLDEIEATNLKLIRVHYSAYSSGDVDGILETLDDEVKSRSTTNMGLVRETRSEARTPSASSSSRSGRKSQTRRSRFRSCGLIGAACSRALSSAAPPGSAVTQEQFRPSTFLPVTRGGSRRSAPTVPTGGSTRRASECRSNDSGWRASVSDRMGWRERPWTAPALIRIRRQHPLECLAVVGPLTAPACATRGVEVPDECQAGDGVHRDCQLALETRL
ncbi:hypothetical protein BH24ACT23_BH24ACT23_07770 [soil metagenome]